MHGPDANLSIGPRLMETWRAEVRRDARIRAAIVAACEKFYPWAVQFHGIRTILICIKDDIHGAHPWVELVRDEFNKLEKRNAPSPF